jgi:hypothetical protein
VLRSLPTDLGQFLEVINDVARRMSPLAQLAEQASGMFGFRLPGFGAPPTPARSGPAIPARAPAPAPARAPEPRPAARRAKAATRKTTTKKRAPAKKKAAPRKP